MLLFSVGMYMALALAPDLYIDPLPPFDRTLIKTGLLASRSLVGTTG